MMPRTKKTIAVQTAESGQAQLVPARFVCPKKKPEAAVSGAQAPAPALDGRGPFCGVRDCP